MVDSVKYTPEASPEHGLRSSEKQLLPSWQAHIHVHGAILGYGFA